MEFAPKNAEHSWSSTLCRGCLTLDRTTSSLSQGLNRELFQELTNISLESNVRWLSLCWECVALLRKCVQFRRKVIQSHTLLLQYANVDQDKLSTDLAQYSSSTLAKSHMFTINSRDSKINGDIDELHNTRSVYEVYSNVTPKQELTNSENERDFDDFDNSLEYLPPKVEFNIKKEIFDEDSISNLEDEIILSKRKKKNGSKERERKKSKKDLKKKIKSRSSVEEISKENVAKYIKEKKSVDKKKTDKTREKVKEPSKPKRAKSTAVLLDPTKIRTLSFTEEEQLQQMEERRTDPSFLQKPFRCILCCTGFNYEKKLREHMRDKHEVRNSEEKSFKCKICHFAMRTRDLWKSHMRRHAYAYECIVCGWRGLKKPTMMEHYSFEHEGNFVPYKCEICDKLFVRKITYNNHMRNHANEQQVQCDHCNRVYSRKDKLIWHMRKHYEDPTTRPFLCHCGYRTRTAKQLEIHSVSHSSDRPYYCVECDRGFKLKTGLDIHLRWSKAHGDPSKFRFLCVQCPRRFAIKGDLKRHVESKHLCVKRHTCDACGKNFLRRDKLAKHIMYVHQGVKKEKTHGCEVCGKMFTAVNLLVNHVRIHTGEKPFACTECSATFNQTGTLSTHIRLVHRKLKRPLSKNCKKDENQQTLVQKDLNSADMQLFPMPTFPMEVTDNMFPGG